MESIWDKFDISKISNAGIKLEYVSPKKDGDSMIGKIGIEDIESEIAY